MFVYASNSAYWLEKEMIRGFFFRKGLLIKAQAADKPAFGVLRSRTPTAGPFGCFFGNSVLTYLG
jgi:hypothetical protein